MNDRVGFKEPPTNNFDLVEDAISKIIGPEFQLLRQENLPLLIREHERKYQYIVSHLMIWQRL